MTKKHEQAFELFKESEGSLSNAEIAKAVGAAESTVRKWKSRYNWLEQLGLDQNVTVEKNESVTKSKPSSRELQHKRIIDSLVEAGTYSPALDLLIEVYLDCFEEYEQAKEIGENTEKLRKELARLLGQLGLDGKNKDLIKKSGTLLAKGDEEKKKDPEPESESSKLVQFRQRKMRS
ncbi:phage terminase small subunit-related protein [Lysinibacillus boronitolerans]|uniref:phage terminase small subunit-related protein n=1 Tax=Lysinibacillus boronitolerans TaxID=309788 RepID=UPI0021620F1B|nr:phage terminase small subunit-related protein [Lysinibacillus boronitolerans]MCS1392986.1 phage terminase small subunit-related protein [Lysinibacillus boronitolerans]